MGGEVLPGSITVSPTMLSINENGGTGSFTITLDETPEGAVVIDLASADESEATVSPAQITLDAGTMSGTVTVTGVDDMDIDGAQTVTITTGVTGTGNYAGVDAADVTVTVNDNDAASGSVTPTGITVFEDGADGTFDVVLGAMPSGTVTIPISVSDATEIATDVTELTFDATNFAMPQTVTVSGVSDTEIENQQTLSVIVGAASGGGYDGIDLTDVSVTLIDDDMPTVAVTPMLVTTSETGTTATFDVSLNPAPSADVVITATSADPTEGSVDGPQTIAAGQNTATFTVTGLDDTIQDGPQTYQITLAATSADAGFDGIAIPAVSVLNNDDDNASVLVSPTLLSVNEQGATSATFTVALGTDPGAAVSVDLTNTDTTQATLSTTSLAFDSTNFATPQTVTVTAIDDTIADGNVAIQIQTAMTATGAYANIDPADVTVNVIDNDAAGITVAPTTGLQTTEAGGTATFTVVLNSQPTGNVTIDLTSSDTTEGTISASSVTFTTGTWNTPQTITVSGVDDIADDGNVAYTIVTAAAVSTDTAYSGRNAADVQVTNADDDQAGFIVTPTTGLRTSEAGTTQTFTVRLTTPPSADVNIPIQSTNTSEGTVAPQSLTFTSTDWQTPQTVTITGVDDALTDGPIPYTIVLDQTTSADGAYNQLDPPNVSVTNDDNEAGFTVTPLTLPAINESGAGATTTFTVRLNSPPSQNVVIGITGDGNNNDEYTFDQTQFVFTPANWLTARTVTVTGVPDALLDGTQTWQMFAAVTTTIDTNYAANCGGACPPKVINGSTQDSDSISVSVTPNAIDFAEGDCQLVTVALSTDATTALSFNVTLANPSQLTLQNVNANIAAGDSDTTFEVCGIDDILSENTVQEVVTISPLQSANVNDPYHNLDPQDVNVTLRDNDTPQVIVTSFNPGLLDTIFTTEQDQTLGQPFGPGLAAVAVRLSSPPTASVIVTVTTNNPAEAIVADQNLVNVGPSLSLVFQPSNWNQNQFVVGVGVDDNVADGTQPFALDFASQSSDMFYNMLTIDSYPGLNLDDDAPSWTVLPLLGNTYETDENGTCDFWLALVNTAPTDDIDITLGLTPPNTPSNDEIVFGASTSFTFPAGFAFANIVLGVCGVDDSLVDGDQTWTVFPATQNTTDAYYASAPFPTVTGVNLDNDTAGLDITYNSSALESAGPSDIDIALLTQPTGNVTVTVTSGDTTEATIPATTLTFTPTNWFNAQTVQYDAQLDNVIDGNQTFNLTFAVASSDALYSFSETQPLTIVDIDQGNFIFNPTNASTVTTNEGGGTYVINVRLTAIPTGNVTLPVFSFNTGEATVSPASLTFTPANWNQPQPVTVTGVDDLITDGDQPFEIWFDVPTSSDPAYDGHPNFPVLFNGLNADNEVPGVSIVQPTAPEFLVINENGRADTFQVRLNTAPTGNNIVRLLFGSTSAANCGPVATTRCARAWPTNGSVADQPVVTSSLTFDATNWNVLQTVTLTGENNTRTDATEWFYVNTTIDQAAPNADPSYTNASIFIPDVLAVSIDNDQEDIVLLGTPLAEVAPAVFGSSNQVQMAAITGETGRTATFYVLGTDLPTGNVTVNFTYGAEATGPASFTLTQSNYQDLNPIVITGQNDGTAVDTLGFTAFDIDATTTSEDPNYNLLAGFIQGYNLDNDQCRLVMLPPTTAGSRMAGGASPTVLAPFVVATTAPLTMNVPVQALMTYSGAVSVPTPTPPNLNVTFTSGAQVIPFQAYATANNTNFQIDLGVITAGNCYINAVDQTLFGVGR
jgi:hypothetical protein